MSFIHLSSARLSFPHLVEPQANRNEPTKPGTYNGDLIPSESDWTKFMTLCTSLVQEKFKDQAPIVMNLIQAKTKLRCFGSGNEKINGKTGEIYAGYAGNMFISAKSFNKPQIVDASGKGIDGSNTMLYRDLTSKMYAGCRVNAVLKPWIQDNEHGRAIRCELVALQFAADDEPFGKPEADVTSFFGAVATAPTAAATVMGLPPFMMAK